MVASHGEESSAVVRPNATGDVCAARPIMLGDSKPPTTAGLLREEKDTIPGEIYCEPSKGLTPDTRVESGMKLTIQQHQIPFFTR